MYNENVKREFIKKFDSTKSRQKFVIQVMKCVSQFEEKYDCDFIEMNESQVKEVLDNSVGYRVDTVKATHNILKEYAEWRRNKSNLDNLPSYVSEIQPDILDKFKVAFVGSPQHLKVSLDAVFPKPELNSIEYIYKTYLWLAFMGLFEDEAFEVTVDEVNFDDRRIHHKGISYRIYEESIQDIRNACNLTEFTEPRGKKGIKRARISGNTILRMKEHKANTRYDSMAGTVRTTLSKSFAAAYKKYGGGSGLCLKASFKRAYRSGIFYREFERERIGIPVTFNGVAAHERKHSIAKQAATPFTLTSEEREAITNISGAYKRDYQIWKRAFAGQ